MTDDNPFADDDLDKTVIRPAGRADPSSSAEQTDGKAPAASPGRPSPNRPSPNRQGAQPSKARARTATETPSGAGRGSGPRRTANQTSRDRAEAPTVRRDVADASQFIGGSITRLVDAAAPMFALVVWTRDLEDHPDPEALLERAIVEIRSFENAALAAGYTTEQIRTARYALCATMDDVVLATPWGGQSVWNNRGLVSTVHRETLSGERFYDVLDHLWQRPKDCLEELKLMYICLSLGFEGKYRVMPRGANELNRIRDKLYRIIHQYLDEPAAELSPAWRGRSEDHRPLGAVMPLWLPLGGMLALLIGVFAFYFTDLRTGMADTMRSIAMLGTPVERVTVDRPDELEPIEMPDRPDEPDPEPTPTPEVTETPLVRIAGFLEPEIEEDLVEVDRTADGITVRIVAANQFESGSTVPTASMEPIVRRIGAALDDETGGVLVVGHTDNVPVRAGAEFADNRELSQIRAESIADILRGVVDDPDRIGSQGMGAEEPIASNDTAEGQARNRRIEVILRTPFNDANDNGQGGQGQ